MRSIFSYCIIVVFLLNASVPGVAYGYTYVVKKGNSLSKIAGTLIPGPVWGKDGSFIPLLARNPQIKNPALIQPGQFIDINEDLTIAQQVVAGVERSPSSEPAPLSCPQIRQPASEPVVVQVPTEQALAQEVPFVPQSFSSWTIAPIYSLSGITAKDKTTGTPAVLASQFNLGFDLHYYQNWSARFKTFILFHLGIMTVEPPADSTKTVSSGSKFLTGIGFGADHRLSRFWRIQYRMLFQKELFIRAVSTQSVFLDAVSVPSAGATVYFDAIHLDPFVVGVSGTFNYKMAAYPGSYTVQSGREYGASIYMEQFGSDPETGNSSKVPDLVTELGFLIRSQDTSVTTQTQTDLYLKLKFSLPFGEKKKTPISQ